MKRFIYPFLIIFLVLSFFTPIFIKNKLPIPSDTIVGLYHPFRDYFSPQYPNGIPFKNFLITDPVRQQYPWRYLAITQLKKGDFPLWNPYNGMGTPLFGNLQSSVLYPFNIFAFFLPFPYFWSLIIVLQPLLGSLFFYFYMRNLNTEEKSSLLGAVVFAFCGFSIAWIEWGTVLHVSLWLPLILLSIDKINGTAKKKKSLWPVVFILALVFSFYGGYLQTSFYLTIVVLAYIFYRSTQEKNFKKIFILLLCISFLLSAIQLIPAAHFIAQSGREGDLAGYKQEGWFIPWQNAVQFVAPDFFGNPATLNYWGVWNYAELVGYVGILPLIFALTSLFKIKDRNRRFFIVVLALALIFAFPTFIAQVPFILHLPFVSTSQPTRLIFVIDFCLAVLTTYGFNDFLTNTNKTHILRGILVVGFSLIAIWAVVLLKLFSIKPEDIFVAKNNMVLPVLLLLGSAVLIVSNNIRSANVKKAIPYLMIGFVVFDLFRFGYKFVPFTDRKYLFPKTQITNYLREHSDHYRFMVTDSRIFPPNFNDVYGLASLSIYDPLYLKQYGAFIAASERGKPDINEPFGFNRIIDPHNIKSPLLNLMGVKYVLSFDDLGLPYKIVFQEGKTKVFENPDVFPRAFFVLRTIDTKNSQDEINHLFDSSFKLRDEATVNKSLGKTKWSVGKAEVISYNPNRVVLKTNNEGEGFLILSDSYYDTWKCTVDGKNIPIVKADFTLRGVVVPNGTHRVEFRNYFKL